MKTTRFIILVILVLVSLGLLLYAGSRASTLTYISALEKGERGAVQDMLEKGIAEELESYHLRQVRSLEIQLPQAPAYAPLTEHPLVERFFYADMHGNIMIKGLSDKNMPEDLSQKCLLFADSRLNWYQARLLFEAFTGEKIRHVYLAGLMSDGHLAYTPVEVVSTGPFMVYPYIICLMDDGRSFYYYRDEEQLIAFSGLDGFKKVALTARESSPVERPFLRLVASYKVTIGGFYNVLNMFRQGGVKALTMPTNDDRVDILAEIAELTKPKKEEEEGK